MLARMLLVAALPHQQDSSGRGSGAKRKEDFCRKCCSPRLCLSLSGLAASSLASVTCGAYEQQWGRLRGAGCLRRFPPASRLHQDSLRADSSEQIEGEGLR